MKARRESVTVRVPGSTSNCGAGFDTLGLALTIYNRVTLTRAGGPAQEREGGEVTVKPEKPGDAGAQGLVASAAEAFFREVGRPAEALRFRIEGDVPPARGLGSSATIIVGVLAGLDVLFGSELTSERIAALGTALEGNPDNASPCVLGGFTASRCDPATGAYRDTIRMPVAEDIAFVVASPEMELATKASRAVLPATVPFFDAAKSINSAAYVVAAFATGNVDALRHAAGDFMHEPYRLPLIPGARAAIDAGCAAGAVTGWLSGSGSSVLCVARAERAAEVEAAMRAGFAAAGVASTVRVLAADNRGLVVE
jgi:homoserine kinase